MSVPAAGVETPLEPQAAGYSSLVRFMAVVGGALERSRWERAAGGHKALVFSQFVDYLRLLRTRLDALAASYQYLDGSTPADERALAEGLFSGEGFGQTLSIEELTSLLRDED